MDTVILGRNIYKARRDRGLSGDKLSELCDVTPSYLRQIEAGSKTPSMPLFVALCNQLRVSPDYLLNGVVDSRIEYSTEEISDLVQAASPSQLRLIAAMIRTASEVCGEAE
jgi:transcriptional regulator with XRE-family HTH domain